MGTDLQEPAVLKDTDPVTQTSRLFEIVGDEDQGPTSPTQELLELCLLYTSPSPRDQRGSRMPSSA